MSSRILLVNPPIFDFSAYDFWLKPYGMLRAAGFLRRRAEFRLFDFMDRLDARVPPGNYRMDEWGRGQFYSAVTENPRLFSTIRRRFKRFGLPRLEFQNFLQIESPFDYALVQTGMTYWYPGVAEVIRELRARSPRTRIILGGVYSTLCPSHARGLGADLVVDGLDLDPLWRYLQIRPDERQMPLWDLYPKLRTGVLKLADGCPFRCTYCSVPQVYPKFSARPLERTLAELEFLIGLGAGQIAFYDDALLYQRDRILIPFLKEVLKRSLRVRFHTPNAINACFVDRELADLMVQAGFGCIYLGFESGTYEWQKKTGGKVYLHELARAVEELVEAGADRKNIHAYLIAGHPLAREQNVEHSMVLANQLGIKVMLAEFSPIPGTPDGELCRKWVDLDEPLSHNKTAFAITSLGEEEIQHLKNLAGELNRRITRSAERMTSSPSVADLSDPAHEVRFPAGP